MGEIKNVRKVRCHKGLWKTRLRVSRLGTIARGVLKIVTDPSVHRIPRFCPCRYVPQIRPDSGGPCFV